MQCVKGRAVFPGPLREVVRRFFPVFSPYDRGICNTPLNNVSRLPVCTVSDGEYEGHRTCEQWLQNVEGAVRAVGSARVTGRNVIIVDDVMTTGTILSACARVLKRAAIEQVWAATVARTFSNATLHTTADYEEEGKSEAVSCTASV